MMSMKKALLVVAALSATASVVSMQRVAEFALRSYKGVHAGPAAALALAAYANHAAAHAKVKELNAQLATVLGVTNDAFLKHLAAGLVLRAVVANLPADVAGNNHVQRAYHALQQANLIAFVGGSKHVQALAAKAPAVVPALAAQVAVASLVSAAGQVGYGKVAEYVENAAVATAPAATATVASVASVASGASGAGSAS